MSERRGRPDDAIVGVAPARAVTPATVDEAAALVAEGAGRGEALAFVGGGTLIGLGAAPERLDTVVYTTGLDRLIEHAPADQIVTVEAGLRLSALQRRLAEHRQRLALDPPAPERATIGGIIAANAYGPLRARFGGVRDLLIGIGFVRADGSRVKGGAKVVKNVAGFDLPKLLVGSVGTLGLIVSATFRLHPLPEVEETLRLDGLAAADVSAWARRIVQAQLEPSALIALDDGDGIVLLVRYEGFGAGVAEQRQRTLALFCEGPGRATLLDGAAAAAAWARVQSLGCDAALAARLAAPLGRFEELHGDVAPSLLRALDGAALAWQPRLGLGVVAGAPNAGAVAALAAARARLSAAGGSLVLTAAPLELRAQIDAWGPPPSSLPLMRALKERFDPQRRLAPGRFVGGI
jgi:glycolate oxidase FAD binding subunit